MFSNHALAKSVSTLKKYKDLICRKAARSGTPTQGLSPQQNTHQERGESLDVRWRRQISLKINLEHWLVHCGLATKHWVRRAFSYASGSIDCASECVSHMERAHICANRGADNTNDAFIFRRGGRRLIKCRWLRENESNTKPSTFLTHQKMLCLGSVPIRHHPQEWVFLKRQAILLSHFDVNGAGWKREGSFVPMTWNLSLSKLSPETKKLYSNEFLLFCFPSHINIFYSKF
jgi:hypothetical protein